MDYDYSELVQRSQHWAAQAMEACGLDMDQLETLFTLDTASPKTLTATHQRTLIVAFLGGTGVGKSTLLNRLVGQNIAKTGIERPTSLEVTLYHHHELKLQNLPSKLPLDKIKISQHNDTAHQTIVWVDMPDFDSTELANKQLVLQWLPHIDVLLYVVSPDRYQDRQAWKLLRAEGQKHGWVFVFNQWDLARDEQYEDFRQQLLDVGFNHPIIFQSSSQDQAHDECVALLNYIQSLATSHTIAALERHTDHIKKYQLQQCLQHYIPLLGKHEDFERLKQYWQQQWQQTAQTLAGGLNWMLTQYAHQYAQKETSLLAQKIPISLWDTWAQNRLDDCLDKLILEAHTLKISSRPLRKNLQPIRQEIGHEIDQQVELSCRQALIKPGHLVHRLLLKLSYICEIILPITSMGIVGYQLFLGFYQSAQDKQAYLGTDFAIHSILIIAISWLIPYFFRKKMQPSIEKSAIKGLKKGLSIASQNFASDIDLILENLQQQQQHSLIELNLIIHHCQETEKIEKSENVARILLD